MVEKVAPSPTIVHRKIGGCIAVSARGESLKIGVCGADEAEARERYADALMSWHRILARDLDSQDIDQEAVQAIGGLIVGDCAHAGGC